MAEDSDRKTKPQRLIEEAPDFDFGGDGTGITETDIPETDTPREFSFGDVDRTSPEGGPDLSGTVIIPSWWQGIAETLGMVVDFPAMIASTVFQVGAEEAGWERGAKSFERPFLLADAFKEIFEIPATIESLITGESPTWTAGFTAHPRAAQTPTEQAAADAAYMTAGALSFQRALATSLGKFRKPATQLFRDAMGRGPNSTLARWLLRDALAVKRRGYRDPSLPLKIGLDEYASRFAYEIGTRPARTLGRDLILSAGAGVGFGTPEFLADHDGKIMMDLSAFAPPSVQDIAEYYGQEPSEVNPGEVDVKPALKILASMGLPVLMLHTPSGLSIAADKSKITPLLSRLLLTTKKMVGDLIGGIIPGGQGRYDLAARVWMAVTADPAFMTETFLPAVKAGLFRNPTTNAPMRILEDGSAVPRFGGINPDTMQALRILGFDDTRLAALEKNLAGSGNNLQARIGEANRRARLLDETFDLLKTNEVAPFDPDEALPKVGDIVKRVRDNLAELTNEELGTALFFARTAYRVLEPQIGAAEASTIAISMLDDSRRVSSGIRGTLWSSENIGTEAVNASNLGDWAAAQLDAAGRNRFAEGNALLFKLAGRGRLEKLGIGVTGEPLTLKDLGGLRDGDIRVIPEEIPENGLFDVFGEPGDIMANPVRIKELSNWRSDLGDSIAAAWRGGKDKVAHRLTDIRNFIDDSVLVEENLIGDLTPTNLRNLRIARAYTQSQKERWGPKTELGKLLRGQMDPIKVQEFLKRFIQPGPSSGGRVEAFQNALNEPQLNITDDAITWEQNPSATLTPGGNPNVIEAELLRRFTESTPFGKVTPENVDSFLSPSRYGPAVDRVPGLRERFLDLKKLQAAVDAMSTKITNPTREQVQAAMENGGSIQDIETANLYNIRNLSRLRQGNIAAEYLNADPEVAAEAFIRKAMADPNFAESRSRELSRILDTDPTGEAAAGFRGALWNALRKASLQRRQDPSGHGDVVPGINGRKLAEYRDKLAPFLARFFGNQGMAHLDEIILGTSLQEPGIRIPLADVPKGVLAGEKGWGTAEAVAFGGRTLGQWVGARLGVSGLVATGQGRRVSVYLFKSIGEKEIMQHVEDAFRNPEKAAALIERARQLPTYEPPPAVKRVGDRIVEEPLEAGREMVAATLGLSERSFSNLQNALQNYSADAIRRAVSLGLLPAQAETRRIDLETDWLLGRPFIYRDNKIRFNLERFGPEIVPPPRSLMEGREPPVARVPQTRATPPRKWLRRPPPITESTLNTVRPVGALPVGGPRPQGTPRPDTMAQLQNLGMDLFPAVRANKGGIVSIKKKKPRQMVY